MGWPQNTDSGSRGPVRGIWAAALWAGSECWDRRFVVGLYHEGPHVPPTRQCPDLPLRFRAPKPGAPPCTNWPTSLYAWDDCTPIRDWYALYVDISNDRACTLRRSACRPERVAKRCSGLRHMSAQSSRCVSNLMVRLHHNAKNNG
jgi:hypothetical protein